jgi:ribosomal protein S13
MSLESDLQEIRGIGEAKASEIVEVVDQHSGDSEAQENVRKALAELEEGRVGYAQKFLERVESKD